ncbi:MAG: hypothetical protein GY775_08285 [Candidatus Scalindua sp.]|nr:hypothetical protein [Candidatus Scalindua sp.]
MKEIDLNGNVFTNDTKTFLKLLDREIENTYSIDHVRDIIEVMVVVYRLKVAGVKDKDTMDYIRHILFPS